MLIMQFMFERETFLDVMPLIIELHVVIVALFEFNL